MNASPPNEPLPGDAPTGRADEQLAHAHDEIVRADEQLTRLSEQLAKLERDDSRPPAAGSDPQPPPAQPPAAPTPPMPTPPTASPPAPAPVPPSSTAKPALRVPVIMLMLAAAVIVAVLVLQLTYDGGARSPQLASAPSPTDNSALPAPPASPAVRVATAEAASSPPPIALAQAAPQDVVPATPAAVPDQAQLLQTIARDLANLEKNLEQLKATQQQIANDNSKAIGDLKASQEEMKRALAKVSEQGPARTLQPAAQPVPTVRKPERAPQARARPRYPREWMYDDW